MFTVVTENCRRDWSFREKLIDAVYARRGWTSQGVPTLRTVRDLGIDYPEVLEVIQKHL